jgi:serine/threonine protein kinase
MDLGNGELQHRAERPRLARCVVRYMQQVASGIDRIHAAGMVHRDIKPAMCCSAPSASGNVEDQPKQRTDLDKWASASPGRDLNHASPPLGAGSSATLPAIADPLIN